MSMIGMIGMILAVAISLCWYLPGIRAQGENRVLTKKDYWRTAVVCVFCHVRLWVIASESPWDAVADRVGPSGFQRDILSDIFRSVLLDGFFRFTGLLMRSVP